MKHLTLLFLAFVMCFSISACNNAKEIVTNPEVIDPVHTEIPLALSDLDKDAETETEKFSALINDDSWCVEETSPNVVEALKEAFITAWNSGWRIMDDKPIEGETIKDVIFFKKKDAEEKEYPYVCLVRALIYMEELYKNDGTTYWAVSDSNSGELVERYMYSSFSEDSISFAFAVYGFFTNYDDALKDIKGLCGDTLISVLTKEDRIDLINATMENKGNEIYEEMKQLLKQGHLKDAEQLYYKTKTTDLTYRQSRNCLIELTEYQLLNMYVSAIRASVKPNGTFILDYYEITVGQDKEYSDDENDLIVFLEVRYTTTLPTLGTKKDYEIWEEHITLDVEGKTFIRRKE